MARLSLGSLALGALLMLTLHFVPPTDEMDPVRRTLSQYALSPNKWIFDLSVLLVAIGSALVFLELTRRRLVRPLSAPVLLGAVWTASLLIIVAFTKTNWAVGPGTGGVVHRYASLTAFVSLPLAVIMVAGAAFPHATGWRWAARGLGGLSLGWFTLIMIGVVNMYAGDGRPWWRFVPLGLVERLVVTTAVAAIAVVVLGLVLASPQWTQKPPGRSPETPAPVP
ncbi:MAG TPA: DUF998 domain-containing protein [Actinophytocola sp.]|uniref:DUF998 domain-containing protein n=1 Tax=Actinophytocola sp. TaxID=1872138 RepID=UPI002DDD6845|nr:DUF998 domain-containing protein [Actinophytocola sp.]HEV2780684.1 DUF998 domain-containing protein [Actinophytocola sp.]